jgi:hypothetical protein
MMGYKAGIVRRTGLRDRFCRSDSSRGHNALTVTPCAQDMPDMPGCSVLFACVNGTATNATLCDGFSLLATICADMPSMSGCVCACATAWGVA